MSRRLLLLRHGRTAWNAEGRFQGQSDPPLDDVGRAQAWEAATLVAALRPDVLLCSTAQRATQTAEPLARLSGLTPVPDERLRERCLGRWEGLTRAEVEVAFPEQYARWVAGLEVERPGGESRDQVAARALPALADLPGSGLAVVVTHSATAMALSAALLGLPQRLRVLAPLANCHWTELRETLAVDGPGTWRVRAHNIGPAGPVVPVPLPVADVGEDVDYAPDATA